MADLYIHLHTSFLGHRKVKMLARRLEVSENEATGALVNLWLWAQEQRNGGDLSGLTDEEVAIICRYEGEKSVLEALIGAKFVDPDLRIHDWDDYCAIAQRETKRSAAAGRKRKQREREREDAPPDPLDAPAFVCPVARLDLEGLGLADRVAALVPNSGYRHQFEETLIHWVLSYCKAAKRKSAGLTCEQRCAFCQEQFKDLISEVERVKAEKGVEPGAIVGQLLKNFRKAGRTDLGHLIGDSAFMELRALEKNRPVELDGLPLLGVSHHGEG